MLNAIWIGMIVVALAVGALTGTLDAVSKTSVDSAKAAVELAIGLVGVMALWLGLMRVLQVAGLVQAMARGLKPLMTRLFPDVPPDHPAMGMMILNFVANMLGLANAATPFGIKAMQELDKLNPTKGTATNAMALFLAINTSGLALLPTGVIAVRASLGSQAAGAIVLPTLLMSLICLFVAVVSTKLLIFAVGRGEKVVRPTTATAFDWNQELSEVSATLAKAPHKVSGRRMWMVRGVLVALLAALAVGFYLRVSDQAVRFVDGAWTLAQLDLPAAQTGIKGALWALLNEWLLGLLIVAIVLYGLAKDVRVYDAVVEGGKEGFATALRIIPFLVAILVAIGMLRASGAIDALQFLVSPLTDLIGMPKETLPMAIMRPLSGSGAYGVAVDTMKTYGPDSLAGNIVSTMQANETTFYVLAVYFGAVQVQNPRFTLIPCLLADAVSVVASVWLCTWLMGG